LLAVSSETFDNDDSVDPDQSSPGWQPLLERPGYEQWWDGVAWRGRAHREPDPFSAFSPDFARSLRPGPNRSAHVARWGIAAIILGFVLQTVVASEAIVVPEIEQIALIVASITLTAVLGITTAVAALLGLKAAPHLGGRAMSTLALGASIVLGMAPVLLLVAIGLAGGV
jgi:hypothetical protein